VALQEEAAKKVQTHLAPEFYPIGLTPNCWVWHDSRHVLAVTTLLPFVKLF